MRGQRTRPSTLVGAWVGNGLVTNFGDFESIATTTLSSSTSTITFSSIPSTYKHLQIRHLARTDRADVIDEIAIVYNADTTGTNYSFHQIVGDGGSASVYGGGNEEGLILLATGATATSSVFGVGVVDILDYANTNKYKTHRSLGGFDNNGSGRVGMSSGVWRNTAAITSIRLAPNNAANFVQYSQFALYGIKG